MAAVPQKIVLKSTTKISLNDRFTSIQKQKISSTQVRAKMVLAQQASAQNRRLAQQMANRPVVQDALHMGGIKRGLSLQQRLGRMPVGAGNIKNRLTLDTRRGGFRGRGRGGFRGGRGATRGVMRGGAGGRGRGRGRGASSATQGYVRGGGDSRGRGRGRGGRGRGFTNQYQGYQGGSRFGGRGRGYQGRGRGYGSESAGMRGQRRGRGRGQRGAGRGRGRGGPGNNTMTREALDNQLEEYMSKTKGALDAELDAYMAQTTL